MVPVMSDKNAALPLKHSERYTSVTPRWIQYVILIKAQCQILHFEYKIFIDWQGCKSMIH
jgi:hypothetical protein